MKPHAAIPMFDPEGIFFQQLRAVTPTLKELFATVFVCVPLWTQRQQPDNVAQLESDPFFDVTCYAEAIPVGLQFARLYARAAELSNASVPMHLCYIDRVAFALQSPYREAFMADIESVQSGHPPQIFQRSEAAWQTHPQNYRAIEQMVTMTGELLIGRALDFAWCHMVMPAGRLREVMACTTRSDLSLAAEMVLAVRDNVITKDVDWLAWEDPFIYGRDAGGLRLEREASSVETLKRLGYTIPMLELLVNTAKEGALV